MQRRRQPIERGVEAVVLSLLLTSCAQAFSEPDAMVRDQNGDAAPNPSDASPQAPPSAPPPTTGPIVVDASPPARPPSARSDAGHADSGDLDAGSAPPPADDGTDAGPADFDFAVRLDCTETLACGDIQSSLKDCVENSRKALKTLPASQLQHFFNVVAACMTFHGCDYVNCSMSQPPEL